MFTVNINSVLGVLSLLGLTIGGIGADIGRSVNLAAADEQPPALREGAKLDREMLLPGEIKRELNQGVILRVELVELDQESLRMTAEVKPAGGQNPKPLRLVNLGIAGNVRVTDAKEELKLTDLKAGNILRIQLESWTQDGEEMAVTYVRLEDAGTRSRTNFKEEEKPARSSGSSPSTGSLRGGAQGNVIRSAGKQEIEDAIWAWLYEGHSQMVPPSRNRGKQGDASRSALPRETPRIDKQSNDGARKGEDARAKRNLRLRLLIDNVLEAHGGQEKLNKLRFAMTVRPKNGTVEKYFVQPPKHLRCDYRQRGAPSELIWILLPHGRQWWTKNPNGVIEPFRPLGAERTLDYWLDYVKFFGPLQVLRLKDANHRVALLDEAIKIDGRAAVGVEVTCTTRNEKLKMYFDKETRLLVRQGETYYSDYKTFDGIPIARKEKHPHAGTGAWEAEITEFQAVGEFDAKLFERP